jgi:hypothetical protein
MPLRQRVRQLYVEKGGRLLYGDQTWRVSCEAIEAIERFERSCWRSLLSLPMLPDEPEHEATSRTHTFMVEVVLGPPQDPHLRRASNAAYISLARRAAATWAPSLLASTARMLNRQISDTLALCPSAPRSPSRRPPQRWEQALYLKLTGWGMIGSAPQADLEEFLLRHWHAKNHSVPEQASDAPSHTPPRQDSQPHCRFWYRTRRQHPHSLPSPPPPTPMDARSVSADAFASRLSVPPRKVALVAYVYPSMDQTWRVQAATEQHGAQVRRLWQQAGKKQVDISLGGYNRLAQLSLAAKRCRPRVLQYLLQTAKS